MSTLGKRVKDALEGGHTLLSAIPPLDLTPDLLGKLFILAWAAHNGRSDLSSREKIIGEFLQGAQSAPQSLRAIMHTEDRITGASIAEFTDFMVSAQNDELLKRYNPALARCAVAFDATEASSILDSFRATFPDVVSWLEERVANLDKTA